MVKKALIIIDMLNDFVLKGASLEVPDARKIIPSIKVQIKMARASSIPVIYICDTHTKNDPEFKRYDWPPHAVKGTEGGKIIKELLPDANDILIEKYSYSSFYNTTLNHKLKELGITHIMLTGCVTHICILFAAYEASLRGYNISIIKDGIAGLESQDHDAGIRIMKNVLGAEFV